MNTIAIPVLIMLINAKKVPLRNNAAKSESVVTVARAMAQAHTLVVAAAQPEWT